MSHLNEEVLVSPPMVEAQGSIMATQQDNVLPIPEVDKTEKPYQPPLIYMAVNPCPNNYY
jgi:hypothetical protein